jgi:hypothetical protein
MSESVNVQYVGFEAKALVREYSFLLRQAASGTREFTISSSKWTRAFTKIPSSMAPRSGSLLSPDVRFDALRSMAAKPTKRVGCPRLREAHISTALEKSSAKRILPPGFKSTSKTNPKAVFLRPGAKNCQSSRLSNHLKLASCKFTVKSRSLPSISFIPKDTSVEETCWRVPTHRVVNPCIEEEWKNSLVDAVFHLFNCDIASSLDGVIFQLSRWQLA